MACDDAAVGCADMSPPSNVIMRRIDDISELKCLLNGVTWTLRCVDGQWDGEMEVCEQPSFNVHSLGDTVLDRFHAFYNMSYSYISSLHPGAFFYSSCSFISCSVWPSHHIAPYCTKLKATHFGLFSHFFPVIGWQCPLVKLASQIAAERCQIQRWFVLTAYGNIPSPYPTVPSSTP